MQILVTPLTFLILVSHTIYSIDAISSDSSSQIDVDAFLNLPPFEHVLAYPTHTASHDDSEVSSHVHVPKTANKATQDADPIAKKKQKKYIRNMNYRKKVQKDPIRMQRLKDQKKASKENILAQFTEEGLKRYKDDKLEKARVQYHDRKKERGYGAAQNEHLKILREKVRLKIATQEEIEKCERNRMQKRKSFLARKQRQQSNWSG